MVSERARINKELHIAIGDCNVRRVEAAIAAGAEVNGVQEWLKSPISSGKTPLHYACASSDPEIVWRLLDNGARHDIPDLNGDYPIHVTSNPEVLSQLIRFGADVNQRGEGGETALHCACERMESGCVEVLYCAKADINAQNNDGETPLHYAASFGHDDVVAMFISYEADLSVVDNHGKTALDYALDNGYHEAAALIQKAISNKVVQSIQDEMNGVSTSPKSKKSRGFSL